MDINGRTDRLVPRSPRRRKKQRIARWMLGLGLAGTLVVFSVLWWGLITVKDSLVSSMVDVESTMPGTLEDTQVVQTVLLRDEQLIISPAAGQVKRVVLEGERVRKGALLAYITEKTLETGSGVRDVPIYAPETGIVSYYVDNLEGLATPDNLDKLGGQKLYQSLESQSGGRTTGQVSGYTPEQASNRAGQTGATGVQSGQPLCKIVNNLKPTYFMLDNSAGKVTGEVYQKEKYLYGKLSANQEEPISFRIQPTSRPGLLVLSSSAFAPELIQKRQVQLNIIINEFQGYIIPQGAVVSRNGQTGIFVVYKEVASWQPVKVKGEARGKVAVEPEEKTGTSRLGPNALVVKNPGLVQEGQVVSVR